MKTHDMSASKSAPAGMNPGEALQATDAVALRDHRAALPKAAELPQVQGTEFHVIKRYEPKADGYPCAMEHQGKLYVGYSNNGGNVGRIGEGRELWNNNSAELAIIPVEKLKVRP